jgi:hypothetical protein
VVVDGGVVVEATGGVAEGTVADGVLVDGSVVSEVVLPPPPHPVSAVALSTIPAIKVVHEPTSALIMRTPRNSPVLKFKIAGAGS